LTSASEQPPLHDGTRLVLRHFTVSNIQTDADWWISGKNRLYMSYILPVRATGMDHKELQGTDRSCLLKLLVLHPFLFWILNTGHQGLQEKIKFVPLDTSDKPSWYKRVYPRNTVRLIFKYTWFPVKCAILATL
jgi:hypothetical protein